jgi:exopolysaccharide biosynthesis protein
MKASLDVFGQNTRLRSQYLLNHKQLDAEIDSNVAASRQFLHAFGNKEINNSLLLITFDSSSPWRSGADTNRKSFLIKR